MPDFLWNIVFILLVAILISKLQVFIEWEIQFESFTGIKLMRKSTLGYWYLFIKP